MVPPVIVTVWSGAVLVIVVTPADVDALIPVEPLIVLMKLLFRYEIPVEVSITRAFIWGELVKLLNTGAELNVVTPEIFVVPVTVKLPFTVIVDIVLAFIVDAVKPVPYIDVPENA